MKEKTNLTMDDPTECSKFSVSDYSIEHLKTAGSTKCSFTLYLWNSQSFYQNFRMSMECSIHKKAKINI